MNFNHTETTNDSPRSLVYCPHMPRFSWDPDRVTWYWITDAIALIASPAIILLNAFAFFVMKRSKQFQKMSNILLCSLAITDLLVGAIVMPLSATIDILILSQASFAHTCMFVRLNVLFMTVLFLATLHHLTVIAWERYVAIHKWKDYKVIVGSGRLKNLAIAAWFFALFQAVPGFIMTMDDVDHRIVEGWYTWFSFMEAACFILIMVFYRKVYLGIRQRNKNEISQVSALVNANLQSKVAKTTALLTAALMFSLIPSILFLILGNFYPVLVTGVTIQFTETVMQLNSLFNPLLYCYRDNRFRNALRELFGKQSKPQALQPAADAARVRRNDSFNATVQRKSEVSTQCLTRTASYNPCNVLHSFLGRPRTVVLKRSLSAPMLNKHSILLQAAIGKDSFVATEQRKTKTPTQFLTRSASYSPSNVLHSFLGRPGRVFLKRSFSAPTLNKRSKSFDN